MAEASVSCGKLCTFSRTLGQLNGVEEILLCNLSRDLEEQTKLTIGTAYLSAYLGLEIN